MLTTLRIKNLALVEDLTLELQPGYNVITGETGAGKSIMIGALNLVLGERADRALIRSGADACAVEAVFDVSKLKAPLGKFLEESGVEPCEDGQLVLKRTFTTAGANRQFVNGSPTNLNYLGRIGEWLVDMHGPHEHQSLLHPFRQLEILDAFGKLESEVEAFAALLNKRRTLAAEKAALIVDEKTYAQQLDLLRFQVREISDAALKPGEREEVEAEYRRASNAARLLQLSQVALEVLAENETSILTQAGIVGRTLQELSRLDPGVATLVELHEQSLATLRELQSSFSRYSEKLDIEPTRLQEIEERLNLIQSLGRKYGPGVQEVIAFGEEARRRLASLEKRDVELERLNGEIGKVEKTLAITGQALTAKRRKLIPNLAKAVSKQLADLGFRQSRFDVQLTTAGCKEHDAARTGGEPSGTAVGANSRGFDAVEFQFAPNPGEPAKPLRAIASSGELARVMLALKTVLAVEDQVAVLVFDEVDANVGGETANAVGEKMKQIAARRQVLCITHLPQVAAPAQAHLLVTKQVKAGRTVSDIQPIEGAQRVTELARMLGGQTDAARKHAEALLGR